MAVAYGIYVDIGTLVNYALYDTNQWTELMRLSPGHSARASQH